MKGTVIALLLVCVASGCSGRRVVTDVDLGGAADAGGLDGAGSDAGGVDAAGHDLGPAPDLGPGSDAGVDSGPPGTCPATTSCFECVGTPGCGFCHATTSCAAGGMSGPSSGTCTAWGFGSAGCG